MNLLKWISNCVRDMWKWVQGCIYDHLEEPQVFTPPPPFYAPVELVAYPEDRAAIIKWLIDRYAGTRNFADEFRIPEKTVQDWYRGRRLPRTYVIRMFQIVRRHEEKLAHDAKYTLTVKF